MSGNGREWYAEMCRRPEWQQKRLRIMERDGWKCRWCGSKDKTLSVHHEYYKRGAMPWEYPDGALITLCEDCHRPSEDVRQRDSDDLLDAIYGCLPSFAIERLYFAMKNCPHPPSNADAFASPAFKGLLTWLSPYLAETLVADSEYPPSEAWAEWSEHGGEL